MSLNETCIKKHQNNTFQLQQNSDDFCDALYDGFLCWHPVRAGENATLPCPKVYGLKSENYAERICMENGTWYESIDSELHISYSSVNCITEDLSDVIIMCNRVHCYEIVDITRYIEWAGLLLSLITLIISLSIFLYFRVLRNNRTTIHINLFIATLLQVILRIFIYLDQAFQSDIRTAKYLCEIINVILEFSKMTGIVWMFIEGLYLHNAITVAMFQEHPYIKFYCWFGWSGSALLTIIWAIAMINTSNTQYCWFLYNFMDLYWILEGPSSAFILINMLFLINIIRILVVKLRESQISEIQQIRKAARAAIFLLPLMGTANVLFMVDYRQFEVRWKFALWSFVTHFLISFQGFFLSTLYCFCNGEVQEALRKRLAQTSLRNMKFVKRNYSREETGMSMLDVDA